MNYQIEKIIDGQTKYINIKSIQGISLGISLDTKRVQYLLYLKFIRVFEFSLESFHEFQILKSII